MPVGTAVGDADEHYTEAYYGGERRADEDEFEGLARDVSSRRLARIEGDLGRRGTILDVGCGTGFLLGTAAARGWRSIGVEVSARAAEAARAQPGVEVHTGTLEDAPFNPGAFDAIVLSHVLEHVPDPVALLARVEPLLASDGILVLALPNASGFIHSVANLAHRLRGRYRKDRFSCSLYPPSHLYAFTPPALVRALSRAHLAATRITVTGKGDPETYPMRTWRGAGRFATAQRIVERTGRAIGRGSLLEVHARRTAYLHPDGAP
jgi:SAM-dependent methyltransferase